MAQVVIAVRGGPAAKSRCGDAAGYAQLVEAMLADMFEAISQTRNVAAVHVVTPTPAVAALAKQYGANVIFEEAASGLNEAFALARRTVARAAPEETVVFLPGDLPLLKAAELERAIASHSKGAAVISPATADGGTGAIVLTASDPFRFRFGAESFRKHIAAAHEAGLQPRVLTAETLGFDLDRPADVKALLARAGGGRTAAFLATLRRGAAA
jgi:2-phospho-L-lactate guanylyltransferase